MIRLHTFQLLTEQELTDTPSRRDGVAEIIERRRRRLAAQHLLAVAHKFTM